jgi:ribonuclease HII
MVPPKRIDEINILQATYEAMREAISKLRVRPDILLNDAVTIPQAGIPQVPIIGGDRKSVSIAAASILAKTYRDDYMAALHEAYPAYQWNKNKGYPTKAHREAIRRCGTTPYHRMTFNLLGIEAPELPFDFS